MKTDAPMEVTLLRAMVRVGSDDLVDLVGDVWSVWLFAVMDSRRTHKHRSRLNSRRRH